MRLRDLFEKLGEYKPTDELVVTPGRMYVMRDGLEIAVFAIGDVRGAYERKRLEEETYQATAN